MMKKNIAKKRVQFLNELTALKTRGCIDMRDHDLCVSLDSLQKSESLQINMQEEDILTLKKPVGNSEAYHAEFQLYKELHKIYFDMQAADTGKSLYLGNGIMKAKGDVNHPLLIKPAVLSFDAENSIFHVKASDERGSKLCAEIISSELHRDNIIAEAIKRVEEDDIFPVSREAEQFLTELINSLTSEGHYVGKGGNHVSDGYNISNEPVLFYGERAQEISDYLMKLDNDSQMPAFNVVMNISEEHDREHKGVKEAIETPVHPYTLNEEQKQAAEAVLSEDISVTTGPPGTGKTLTACAGATAGAQSGKLVLMTAKSMAAINAMDEKLPESLKRITAILNGNGDYKKVSKAVENIIDYYSKYTPRDIECKIGSLESALKRLEHKIQKYRQHKDDLMTDKPVILRGRQVTLASAGKMLLEQCEALSIMPKPIDAPLRMSINELERLYLTNELEEDEEQLFKTNILQELITPAELQREASNTGESAIIELEKMSKYLELFKSDEWMVFAAVENNQGNYHKLYNALNQLMKMQKSFLDEYGENNIEIDETLSFAEIKEAFPKIHQAFDTKGKLSASAMLFNQSIKRCMKGILVNDEPIGTKEDCLAVKAYIQYQLARLRAEELWELLLVPFEVPTFENVGDRLIYQTCDFLECAFDYQNQMEALRQTLDKLDIDYKRLLCIDRYDTKLIECQKTVDAASVIHDLYVEQSAEAERSFHRDILKRAENSLRALSNYFPTLAADLCDALHIKDGFKTYQNHFEEIERLLERKDTIFARRKTLLRRLSAEAPELAEAIENRIGIHGAEKMPDEVRNAIESSSILSKLLKLQDPEAASLAERIGEVEEQMKVKQEELVFWKTLLHIVQKMTDDHGLVEILHTFIITLQKLGKGKGSRKNVAALRKSLRRSFAEVQCLIPIWVMPAGMVFQLVQPQTFDIIIIDEASELDVTQTALLAAAHRALIIGDEQQVEGMTIGVYQDQIKALQDAYLEDISYRHLYDLRTSIFDLAKLRVRRPILLQEHFRCHPAIISLSNELSYDGKLVSLKQPIQQLEPVIGVKVSGKREKKTNRMEAEAVVEHINAMLADDRYNGLTIGIISLLGKEQAALIERLLLRSIPMEEIEKRKISCEGAAGLQGTERDIILISCVDAPAEDKEILRLKDDGAYDWLKKRINVAFSRARTQVLVFYSFEHGHLHKDDLRHRILTYVNRCEKYRTTDIQLTEFEELLAEHLRQKGETVIKGLVIGNIVVPLVWTDENRMTVLNCRAAYEEWGKDLATLRRARYEIKDVLPIDFYVNAATGDNAVSI